MKGALAPAYIVGWPDGQIARCWPAKDHTFPNVAAFVDYITGLAQMVPLWLMPIPAVDEHGGVN